MIVLYYHWLLCVHNDQKIYVQMKAILSRLASAEGEEEEEMIIHFLDRVVTLLENRESIDSMDRAEETIRNNIVLFDPNHPNSELKRFSFRSQ